MQNIFPLIDDEADVRITEDIRKYIASWNPSLSGNLLVKNSLSHMNKVIQAETSIKILELLQNELDKNNGKNIKEILIELREESKKALKICNENLDKSGGPIVLKAV